MFNNRGMSQQLLVAEQQFYKENVMEEYTPKYWMALNNIILAIDKLQDPYIQHKLSIILVSLLKQVKIISETINIDGSCFFCIFDEEYQNINIVLIKGSFSLEFQQSMARQIQKTSITDIEKDLSLIISKEEYDLMYQYCLLPYYKNQTLNNNQIQDMIVNLLVILKQKLKNPFLEQYCDQEIFMFPKQDQWQKDQLVYPIAISIRGKLHIINQYNFFNILLEQIKNNENISQLTSDYQNYEIENDIFDLSFKIKYLKAQFHSNNKQQINPHNIDIEYNQLFNNLAFLYDGQPLFSGVKEIKDFIQNNTAAIYTSSEFVDSNFTFEKLIKQESIKIYFNQITQEDNQKLIFKDEKLYISSVCIIRADQGWEKCFQNINKLSQTNLMYCDNCKQITGIWTYFEDIEYNQLCQRIYYEMVKQNYDSMEFKDLVIEISFSKLNELNITLRLNSESIQLEDISHDFDFGNSKISWIDKPKKLFQEMMEINQKLNDFKIPDNYYLDQIQQGIEIDEDYIVKQNQ